MTNLADQRFEAYRPSQMSREEFVAVFGHVYENSSWIAIQTWNVGLTYKDDTVTGLSGSFIDVIECSGRESQLQLLRAHPKLAERILRGVELTRASRKEQASVGLNDCSEEEFDEFQELNRLYSEKFGFPFILAVGGRHRTEILEIFRSRLVNEVEDELVEALQQVYQIAYLRLREIN